MAMPIGTVFSKNCFHLNVQKRFKIFLRFISVNVSLNNSIFSVKKNSDNSFLMTLIIQVMNSVMQ